MPRDPWTPWKLWALSVVAIITLVISCQSAQAQDASQPINCKVYAGFAKKIAALRSVEARLDLVIQQIRRETNVLWKWQQDALVREAARVYADRLAPDEASFKAYLLCQSVQGDFGKES